MQKKGIRAPNPCTPTRAHSRCVCMHTCTHPHTCAHHAHMHNHTHMYTCMRAHTHTHKHHAINNHSGNSLPSSFKDFLARSQGRWPLRLSGCQGNKHRSRHESRQRCDQRGIRMGEATDVLVQQANLGGGRWGRAKRIQMVVWRRNPNRG